MQIEQRLAANLAGGAVVRPLELTWQSRYQLGSALSPANVSAVLRQADYGYVAPLQDLLSEVRQKHPKLHAALQIRERGVLSLSWSVKPYKKPSHKRVKARHAEVAKACEDVLKGLAFLPMCDQPSGGWRDALAHLLSGVYRGFAVGELVTAKDDAGRVYPKYFSAIASRRFRFVGRSKLVLDDHGRRGPEGEDVFAKYPDRFVSHKPRVTGEEPHREGLGRALLYHICFAVWSWRDWMLFAEQFGRPWVIATTDPTSANTEDATLAQDIVDNADASRGIAAPNGIKVDIKWPEAKGGKQDSPSAGIIDKADEAIVLGVLGQQASMGDVQNGLGGGGDVRDLIRQDLLESDALDLGAVVTNQIFAPFVRRNWGPNEPVPEFVPDLTQAPDAEKLTKALQIGVGLGMRVPREWAQAQLGWPEAGDDEAVLGAPAAPEAPAPGGGQKPAEEPAEGDDEEDA